MTEKAPPVLRDWFYELRQKSARKGLASVFGMIETLISLGRADNDKGHIAWLLVLLLEEVNNYAGARGIDLRAALGVRIDAGHRHADMDYSESLDTNQLDVRAVAEQEVKPEVEPMPRYRVVSTGSLSKFSGVLRELAAEGYLLHSFTDNSDRYTAVFERKGT